MVSIENQVQAAKGGGEWELAQAEQRLAVRDRIRTQRRSRATVQLTGLYTMRMEQLTTVEISPSLLDDSKPKLDLGGGALFIFSREKSGEIDIKTPAANGALRGTQLFVSVGPGGKTFYQVLEGRVEVSNAQGRVEISAGEAAEAAPGSAPRRTAVLEAKNILQWALYYPAVIDPAELEAAMGQGDVSKASTALEAYSKGDLLAALELPKSSSKALEAAFLLAVGRLDDTGPVLAKMPVSSPFRRALDKLVSAVKHEEMADWPLESMQTASEAMAESYYQQSRHNLEAAR
ncbi:MAG: FecR domain-containing protein, partial [Verrucomicrobia bacterium]|nr:FecR domain-containing protein [Verrucomicrobiota bacterium]